MTTFLNNIIDSTKKLVTFLIYSLTKPDFYKDIIIHFKGYGFRFIFTLTFIGSVISSLVIFNSLIISKKYFETREPTNNITKNIDHILNSWEDISYNGYSIKSDSDEPKYILGLNKKILVAVDPKNTLKGDDRKKIPLIFGESVLTVNIPVMKDYSSTQLPYKYDAIFGNAQTLVDSEKLFNILKSHVNYLDKIYIYALLPLNIAINIITIFLEKLLMIAIIYMVVKSYIKSGDSVKIAFRLVSFSCGLTALLLPFALYSVYIGYIINFSQLLTSFYVIYAISSMRKTT